MPSEDHDKNPTDTFEIKKPPLPTAVPPKHSQGRGARRWVRAGMLAALVAAVALTLWPHPQPHPNPPLPTPPPPNPTPVVNPQPLLRIHGSNTIGEALMPELVIAYLEHQGYTGVHKEPVDSTKAQTYVIGQLGSRMDRVEIAAEGSMTGFRALAAGTADIAMSSEKINEKQLASLKEKLGDLSSQAAEHVIALDGVSVIVHANNPVAELDLQQLAGVFSGDVKNWSELGGTPGPIQVYARNDNSGTWEIFKETVLLPFGKELAPGARRIESSEDLSADVAQDQQGIGFIGIPYGNTNKVLGLSNPGLEARLPAPCTLKTEEYVLTRRLYLYTSTMPGPAVTPFITFATSNQAWSIVEKAGFVSLDPTPQKACDNPSSRRHTSEYQTFTKGAQRLLINFSFLPGSFELDNKSSVSIGDLTALLSRPANAGRTLLLLGYADDKSSVQDNKRLSLQRARAVHERLAQHLRQLGMKGPIDEIHGLGAQELLAPHGTAEGKRRNGRVEAWLR